MVLWGLLVLEWICTHMLFPTVQGGFWSLEWIFCTADTESNTTSTSMSAARLLIEVFPGALTFGVTVLTKDK